MQLKLCLHCCDERLEKLGIIFSVTLPNKNLLVCECKVCWCGKPSVVPNKATTAEWCISRSMGLTVILHCLLSCTLVWLEHSRYKPRHIGLRGTLLWLLELVSLCMVPQLGAGIKLEVSERYFGWTENVWEICSVVTPCWGYRPIWLQNMLHGSR